MTRVESWERNTEYPLLFLAAAFLVAYAWPVLDQSIDRDVRSFLLIVSWTVWVAFAADFAIRIYLAGDTRRRYVARHWYDVALIALPMLRPLRVLRLLAFARILNRSAAQNLVGQVTTYVFGAAIAAVGLGSIAILDAEQSAPGANITSFGDAVWWACETVTTVGYGDKYPVTTQGRMIAVALMIVGISMIGAVTAAVAAWMVKQVGERQEAHEASDEKRLQT